MIDRRRIILDVGGEGRHPGAWNLNPSRLKTLGQERGMPIPRWIYGRIQDIPFGNGSVDMLIVERAPLMNAAARELARVICPGGTILLRHVVMRSELDPHAYVRSIICADVSQRLVRLGGQPVFETVLDDIAKQSP